MDRARYSMPATRRPIARLSVIAALLVASACGGAFAMLWAFRNPVTHAWLVSRGVLERRGLSLDNEQENPVAIACPKHAQVVLIAGQSNAASHGESKGKFTPNVVNYYQGKCYAARDPLLGATGRNGSVWSRLAWRGPVVLAPVAIGQTRLSSWAPGGRLWPRITESIDELESLGLPVNYVIWHQGEADAEEATDPVVYRQALERLIRSIKARAKTATVIVSPGTYCLGLSSPAIVAAQRAGARDAGALIGPETDLLGSAYRHDGCHFNNAGLEAVARMWGRYAGVLPIAPKTPSAPAA
ncbi:MAG TPA: sialate O-acetylesterase [Sphingomonas sp.]|nr:sialate O-acetylesterase [Sphingomonas sp.]